MIYFFDSLGKITRQSCVSAAEAELAADAGEQWIESPDIYSDETHYVFSGDFTPFPSRPSAWHEWDWTSLAWVRPTSAADDARASGRARIDTAAGNARKRYITTSPGQDATYTVKYAEALGYIAAGYPSDLSPYPFVAGESQPNTWMTPTQAATRIATLGGYWREVIGPAIEAARINGKDALDSLTDPAAIDAHVAAVVANLDAI